MSESAGKVVSESALRDEVRQWLVGHTQNDRSKVEWMREVVEAGWACPSWPKEWFGRGLPLECSWIVVDEFARACQVGAGQDLVNIPAGTAFAVASKSFKQRWLLKLVTGEVVNSLLYSEPGAGSDLASLQTRAELVGDVWVINGQKVWTSGAQRADFGLLAARTDWDVPKHRGITLFWCPMHQDGIEVRPIRQATGESHFNEVFMTNAKVPRADMIGNLNEGWSALQTALSIERVMFNAPAINMASASSSTATLNKHGRSSRSTPEDLIELARDFECNQNAIIRDELVRFYILSRVNALNAVRAQTEAKQGTRSRAASLGKLATSRLAHMSARLQFAIVDEQALVIGTDSPVGNDTLAKLLGAFNFSIAGGTDQIQRNLIAERALGLPREPAVDIDVPFREVLKPPGELGATMSRRRRG